MVSKTMLQKGLSRRSAALAIPKAISSTFQKLVCKWYFLSGEEWTVDRLKAIKLDIIRRKAGLQPVSSWISRSRSGLFKGDIGKLEQWMFRKERNFERGLQLLQCYTMFYAPRLTEKQRSKFITGVLSEPPDPEVLDFACQAVHKGWVLAGEPRIGKLAPPPPLEEMMPSPSKRAPLPDSSVPESEGIVDSIRFLYDTFEGLQHLNRFYDSHYCHVLSTLEPAMFNDYGFFMCPSGWPQGPPKNHGSLLAGRIGLIQEPGFKLRAVANPGRIFQNVLRPFGDSLYSFIRNLPWDCTHEQTKSFPVLQERLSQGKMVYSIDLSGATDYFPLHLQELLLRKMFCKRDVDLFSELSKSSWYFPGMGEISWKRGQPLGLYPSFGAFALTHGILLLGLLGREWSNDFFVLGDDVVILDDQLAQDYLSVLSQIGCPVAHHKSLQSSSLCEFGGKVITKTAIIPQLKWRDVSDDSFLDIARMLGPRSISLFKPRQIKVIKELATVPEFLNGLGWNPDGIPLQDRVKARWLWIEKKPVDHLMGYSSLKIRNLMSSNLYGLVTFNGATNSSIIEGTTLDQRVSLLIDCLLGKRFSSFPCEILGKNVDMVSLSLYGKHADLPFNPGEGSSLRPSLLMSWEAKLGHLR